MSVPLAMLLLALATSLYAAVCDLRRYEIPNSLTLILLATAAVRGLASADFDWLSHLAAPVLMLAVGMPLFARGWFGGGDVKLLIGLAAWTGLGGLALGRPLPFTGLPLLLALTVFAGGGLAGLLLIGRRLAAGVTPAALLPLLRPQGPVPYAVAIAIGALLWAWLDTPLPVWLRGISP